VDRYAFGKQICDAALIEKVPFLIERCRGKTVLDIGCIRHSAQVALDDPAHWLHGQIKAVAEKVVGVDYLPEEIAKLRPHGFEIVCGDATKPLPIDETFDIIFAGDIVEHLADFKGLFDNFQRLLRPGGELIMTTGNPLYVDNVHYAALKRRILVNPEHTCWICPQTMLQLFNVFGFDIVESHFVRDSWHLKNFICENSWNRYDILADRWERTSISDRIVRRLAGVLFGCFHAVVKFLTLGYSPMVAHSDYVVVGKRGSFEA
jgi:SAM-dependent methyltransferase